MENLSFVLWVVLFPIGIGVEEYISEVLLSKTYSEGVSTTALFINFAVWIWIATLLYRKKTK